MALKHIIDKVVSLIALILLFPFLLTIAILIRLDSPGPAMFRQVRWGYRRERITVFKFRTMYSHLSDPDGVKQTVENDSRVTRIGRFLRKSNLDELPQLLNVLKGDMSLVGPRCHAIDMLGGDQRFEDLVPYYHGRHEMRPGITGLAQIQGLRGPTDDVERARRRIDLDLLYIERFNLILDFKILFRTLIQEIRGGTGF